MLAKLEKLQKQMAECMDDAGTPEKYRAKAARDYVRIHHDIDKIYAAYRRLYVMELKIGKKYGLTDNGE